MVRTKNDYDLDKDDVYNNDEPAVAFSYMIYTDQGLSNEISDEKDTKAPVVTLNSCLRSDSILNPTTLK